MNPGTPSCVLLGNPMNGGNVPAVQTPVLATVVRGPANQVTSTRALLALVVALMVAIAPVSALPAGVLVGTATLALALDWVDGQVARRTGTVTAFGARFDMEVDAFLILVLSVYVARSFGAWVLLIGLARYLLLAAEQAWPWLRRPVPPRYWRKAVAAIQGIVLTVAASGLLPHELVATALVGALLLLAESFGRDVLWLARR
jgi:phosphatidylglycerophosphate synthase